VAWAQILDCDGFTGSALVLEELDRFDGGEFTYPTKTLALKDSRNASKRLSCLKFH